jgi:hypothetical protein
MFLGDRSSHTIARCLFPKDCFRCVFDFQLEGKIKNVWGEYSIVQYYYQRVRQHAMMHASAPTLLLPSVSSSILTMNGYQECCHDNNANESSIYSTNRMENERFLKREDKYSDV